MKISQMLEREDFYGINEQTLADFFGESADETELYIYPQLNAIITKKPSRAVKQYLRDEYDVRGNVLKRMAVKSYITACFASCGAMSSRACRVSQRVSNDTLIYPCNKKYRIFDFDKQRVSVIAKHGFPKQDLIHEIEFRTRELLPDFVPALESFDENGYTERIIDGKPLARISAGYDWLCRDAYALLREYTTSFDRTISGVAYAKQLREKILSFPSEKITNQELLAQVVELLAREVEKEGEIRLTFSHGDLQSGNIWVENGTEKIYIIDWESWAERSEWYDSETLFGHLRPGSISAYLAGKTLSPKMATVLLEDIVFQLENLYGLPERFGCEQFTEHIGLLNTYLIKAGCK